MSDLLKVIGSIAIITIGVTMMFAALIKADNDLIVGNVIKVLMWLALAIAILLISGFAFGALWIGGAA